MTRSRQTADWGSRAGLAKIVPSSVAVGSGTGSADSLGTVTFSGASSISLNGIFSATYRNYRVLLDFVNASETSVSMRLRASGSDLSTSVYNYATYRFRSGNVAANDNFGEGQTSAIFSGDTGTDGRTFYTFEFNSPQIAANTNITMNFIKGITTTGFNAIAGFGGTRVRDSYQADGFSIFPSSGTSTGTITIYGYN
jgi:hypothetical protein